MTGNEIARTFGVFVAAVNANVRSILKNRLLREEAVVRHTHHRDGSVTTRYNLEMITALAFRFKSHNADVFRRWIVQQAVTPAVVWHIPQPDDLPN